MQDPSRTPLHACQISPTGRSAPTHTYPYVLIIHIRPCHEASPALPPTRIVTIPAAGRGLPARLLLTPALSPLSHLPSHISLSSLSLVTLSLLALSLRRYLAFAGDDQLLKIVEIATGAVVAMGQGHSNKVRALLPLLIYIFISLPPRLVPATPTHAFSPAPLPHLSTTPIRHTTPHHTAPHRTAGPSPRVDAGREAAGERRRRHVPLLLELLPRVTEPITSGRGGARAKEGRADAGRLHRAGTPLVGPGSWLAS